MELFLTNNILINIFLIISNFLLIPVDLGFNSFEIGVEFGNIIRNLFSQNDNLFVQILYLDSELLILSCELINTIFMYIQKSIDSGKHTSQELFLVITIVIGVDDLHDDSFELVDITLLDEHLDFFP